MQFTYRAKQDLRTEASGVLDAVDQAAAIAHLKKMGLFPIEVTALERSGKGVNPTGLPTRPLSRPLLALWARTVSGGLSSGLSLTQALHLLAEQEKGRPLGQVAATLESEVTGGASLADAMRRPAMAQLFSPVAAALAQAGEASGALEQVFGAMGDQVEAEAEIVAKVRGALVYPLFVLGVAFVTVAGLIWFVVPKLAALFRESGQTLPWLTQFVIQSGEGLIWVVGAAAVAALGLGLAVRKGWVKLPIGQTALAAGVRLPVFGRLIRQSEMARFSATLGLLLSHGLPLPEALRLTGETISRSALKAQIKQSEREVVEGIALSASFRRVGIQEPFLLTAVAMGEAQGDLARVFTQAGSRYRTEVDRTVKVLSSLIEPIMILIVGLLVGGIVFSMLLPIFDLNFGVG